MTSFPRVIHPSAKETMTLPQTAASRTVIGIISIAALIAAGYAFRYTISCFLLSFVLAYLFDPVVVMLERRRVRRIFGILFLYTVLGVFSFFFFAYFFPFLTYRWETLVHSLPVYLQKSKVLALAWKEKVLVPSAVNEWGWLIDTLTDQADKLSGKAGAGAYALLSRVVFNLFNLILAPILVFFMLVYKQAIITGISSWIPSARREKIVALGREINGSIGGYIRGQFIVSLIVAILSGAALFFLDIDYPILNGIFAGLASILPFIGVILATIPPLFFAYVKFQSGLALFKVLVAFAIIYFFEGYVIKPLVFKESMDLNPLVTIIFVMAFGEMMGFWGILLAIPIAAAVKILLEHLQKGDLDAEI